MPGDAGLTAWGWGIGVTTLCCAFLSPILGAIADAHANKRTWLFVTTMLGAGGSVLMFFGTPDHPWLFVAMFLIANLNYELVQSFYNAFLPEIADDRRMSEVSAWGFGTGYVGGGLMLVVAVSCCQFGETLGPAHRERLSAAVVPAADGHLVGRVQPADAADRARQVAEPRRDAAVRC